MRFQRRRHADRGHALPAAYHTLDNHRVSAPLDYLLDELKVMGYQVRFVNESDLRRMWDDTNRSRSDSPGHLLVVGRHEPGSRPCMYVSRELLLTEDELVIEQGRAAIHAVSDRIIMAGDRIVNPLGDRFQFAVIDRGIFGAALIQQLPEWRVMVRHGARSRVARSRDVGTELEW